MDALFQIGNGRAIPGLLLVDVVCADTGNRVRLVAVHIDQALEAVLLAAVKEPVDWNDGILVRLEGRIL